MWVYILAEEEVLAERVRPPPGVEPRIARDGVLVRAERVAERGLCSEKEDDKDGGEEDGAVGSADEV